MKKLLTLLLAAVLLCGCSVSPADDAGAEESSSAAESTGAVSTTAETGAPETTESTDAETASETAEEVTEEQTSAVQTEEVTAPAVTTEEVTSPPEITAVIGTSSNGKTIELIDGVTYVGGVLVANKTYALPESYYAGGLTAETYSAFVAMQSAAAAEGLALYCKSGFRSYVDQRIIYNGYVDRDGQALADTYSARPGHSEHQTGMALDINSTSSAFADTAEGKWLAENCWDYGFIIRYPADKVEVTGYMYEPWHVRYVGKDVAAELRDSGLCLEEYLGITSRYGG